MTMGPGTVGEKTGEAMGRVGNWLGECLSFPLDWKAFPWKRLVVGTVVLMLAFVGYGLWVFLGWYR